METTSIPRKPFVDRIREEVANGFLMGGAFGGAYHLAKGGFEAVRKNVPRSCFSTAVFFGLYGAVDYAVVRARRKEEPVLDCAVAIGGASGIFDLHRGLRYAGKSALAWAALGGAAMGGVRLLEDRVRNLSPQAQRADDPTAPDVSPKLHVEVPWTPPAAEEIGS
jgi:import inner membrane translocase subunit TIM17